MTYGVKPFIQKKCEVDFGKGRKFSSGGAYCVEGKHKVTGEKKQFMFAYLGKKDDKYTVTDWNGKIISDNVRVISESKWRTRVEGDKLKKIRFKVGSTIYSGSAGGVGSYLKASSTKLKSLYG